MMITNIYVNLYFCAIRIYILYIRIAQKKFLIFDVPWILYMLLYIILSIFVSFDISLIHKYLQLNDDVTIEFIYVIWR